MPKCTCGCRRGCLRESANWLRNLPDSTRLRSPGSGDLRKHESVSSMLTISNATEFVRLDAAATVVGVSRGRIRTYVRAGVVHPARVEGRQMLFGPVELARLRRIRRLSEDLGLNIAGVEVALRLQDQISALRRELAETRTSNMRLEARPSSRGGPTWHTT